MITTSNWPKAGSVQRSNLAGLNTPVRRRVLFIFSIHHHYREMLPVVEHYHSSEQDVHVLIGFSGQRGDETAEACKTAGFTVHHVPLVLKYGRLLELTDRQGEVFRPDSSIVTMAARNKYNWKRLFGAFPGSVRKNYRIVRFARKLLDEIKPDVVFGNFFHSCGEFHNGIARHCSKRQILFCCLPMSPYVGERVAVGYRFEHLTESMFAQLNATSNLSRKALGSVYPRWVRTRNGKAIFMWEPARMVAAKLFGLIDDNPWQSPTERYDIVFVESEIARSMLVESGYDSHKIVISGKPLLDKVFRRLADRDYSAQIRRSLGLSADEAFILVNVEPAAEHAYTTWEQHWERFRQLMECLKKTGRRVVLSLHPLCHPANYSFVEQEYGFILPRKHKIAELYPYCKAIVSFPCSTNQLAPLFQKPLIIYDWFGVTDGPRRDLFRIPSASYARNVDEVPALVEQVWNGGKVKETAAANPVARTDACATVYEEVEKRLVAAGR